MGLLYTPSTTDAYVSRAPIVSVEINGQIVSRAYVTVDSISLSAGILPSVVRLLFPALDRGAEPLRPWDRLRVFLDRHIDATPRFVGRVLESPSATFDVRLGAAIAYSAVDLRHFLADDICSRDFNTADSDGRRRERLGSRAIASAILKEYAAHQATISGRLASELLTWNLASFPDQQVGEFVCKGETHAAALERLVSLLGDGSYRVGMNYQPSGGGQLFAFPLGRGSTQAIVVGSDVTAGEFDQPFGRAMVGDGSDSRDQTKVVNVVALESPRGNIFETAVRLAPNFDLSQSNLGSATKLLAQVQPGPNTVNTAYDSGAAKIGRSFRLPLMHDLDGKLRRLRMAPELCQARFPGDGNRTFRDEPRGPRVVYRWTSASAWEYLTDGFKLADDGSVEFSNALLKERDDEAASNPRQVLELNQVYRVQNLSDQVVHYFAFNGPENPWPAGLEPADYTSGTLGISCNPDGTWAAKVSAGTPNSAAPMHNAVSLSDLLLQLVGLASQPKPTVYVDATLRVAYLYLGSVPGAWLDAEELEIEGYTWASLGQKGSTHLLFFEKPIAATEEAPLLAPPEDIYLQAAWVSEVPLLVEGDPQGEADTIVRRLSTSPDGKREIAFQYFTFTKASATPGFFPATVAQAAWDVTSPLDEDVVVFRDDSYSMRQTATNMAKRQAEGVAVSTRTLPRMPLGFKIGASLVENGRLMGKSITGITYNLGRVVTTTLEATSL